MRSKAPRERKEFRKQVVASCGNKDDDSVVKRHRTASNIKQVDTGTSKDWQRQCNKKLKVMDLAAAAGTARGQGVRNSHVRTAQQ